jgi:hypothetical protein
VPQAVAGVDHHGVDAAQFREGGVHDLSDPWQVGDVEVAEPEPSGVPGSGRVTPPQDAATYSRPTENALGVYSQGPGRQLVWAERTPVAGTSSGDGP